MDTEDGQRYARVMHEHHRRVIERLTERFVPDAEAVALLISGSVARGEARADSDVDAFLVVTDEAFARRRREHALSFEADDLCDYPNGHAGGEVIDLAFLREAVERAPEPTRFAFSGALVAFANVPEVAALAAGIAVYPETERHEKLVSFAAELPVHRSYLAFGEYSRNPYVLAQCAEQLVLFGGRLILAHNRRLFPGRKWFLRELARAPEQPAGLLELAAALLERPSIATSDAFCDAVLHFADWPSPTEGTWDRYRRNHQWRWREGTSHIGES